MVIMAHSLFVFLGTTLVPTVPGMAAVALTGGGQRFAPLNSWPDAAPVEQQGLGWKNKYGSGNCSDTITSGLEGAWTVSPAEWTHNYLENLFTFTWAPKASPAGTVQWEPAEESAADLVPDAHDPNKRHKPIMFTTDLALKFNPAYKEIALRFLDNPEEFEDAFARAWFKLTHRDMGLNPAIWALLCQNKRSSGRTPYQRLIMN